MSQIPSIEEQVIARWEVAAEAVQEALKENLVVAFLGSASSGKDSAIKAIFGHDFGQVDPIPGSTSEVRVAAIDAGEQVLVVNAPGFGDVRGEVDAEARKVMGQLDLCVYVLNCDGGATIDERRDLDAIRALGRPVLVCLNKIDLIRSDDKAAFVAATLLQLGVDRGDAVLTAFDPLPVLSEEPIGVEEVLAWIHRHLEAEGKGLLFAKTLRNQALACDVLIRTAARRSAVAGAIPIPGADATAVTAIQIKLLTDIAAIHSHRIDRDLVLFIIGEALAGGSKGFVRWAVNAAKTAGFIPGGQIVHVATSALGASISAAATWGVGKAGVAFIQSGGELTAQALRDVFDAEAFRWRESSGGGL